MYEFNFILNSGAKLSNFWVFQRLIRKILKIISLSHKIRGQKTKKTNKLMQDETSKFTTNITSFKHHISNNRLSR